MNAAGRTIGGGGAGAIIAQAVASRGAASPSAMKMRCRPMYNLRALKSLVEPLHSKSGSELEMATACE